MRITFISKDTFCCTLTKEEITKRNITGKSLIDGSYEQFDELFSEIIQKAHDELHLEFNEEDQFEYEVEETTNCIYLYISRLSEQVLKKQEVVQGILSELDKVLEGLKEKQPTKDNSLLLNDLSILEFSFKNLDAVITMAKCLKNKYLVTNELYKTKDGDFLLVLVPNKKTNLNKFNSLRNNLLEYGEEKHITEAMYEHLKEHGGYYY